MPHTYVLQRRLESARRLLARHGKQADLPLKVVAANCGFADQSHLNRHFKREYKQTPRGIPQFGGRWARGLGVRFRCRGRRLKGLSASVRGRKQDRASDHFAEMKVVQRLIHFGQWTAVHGDGLELAAPGQVDQFSKLRQGPDIAALDTQGPQGKGW